jgi:hypothetical protein
VVSLSELRIAVAAACEALGGGARLAAAIERRGLAAAVRLLFAWLSVWATPAAVERLRTGAALGAVCGCAEGIEAGATGGEELLADLGERLIGPRLYRVADGGGTIWPHTAQAASDWAVVEARRAALEAIAQAATALALAYGRSGAARLEEIGRWAGAAHDAQTSALAWLALRAQADSGRTRPDAPRAVAAAREVGAWFWRAAAALDGRDLNHDVAAGLLGALETDVPPAAGAERAGELASEISDEITEDDPSSAERAAADAAGGVP